MKYPKLRELVEAIKALVVGPYTTKFPAKPHKPAERFRGKPTPDEDWCIGCGACSEVCPAHAIELKDDTVAIERKLTWRYDKCIFCGQCEALCTTEKGVHLSNEEFDLAAFDRSTLFSDLTYELMLCPDCKETIGTKKHLLWLARKLGPLAYGNFPLILTAQKELKIVKEEPEAKAKPGRSNIFRILCPRCRHTVELTDQYGE